MSVAASPDSKTVFVTGQSLSTGSGYDYATVAYNAATGAQLWSTATTAPPSAPTMPPRGGQPRWHHGVCERRQLRGYRHRRIRYGRLRRGHRHPALVNRYNGPGISGTAVSVAVSPDGESVFVTGSNSASAGYATVAYNAATGALLWVSRYRGSGNGGTAHSVAVSPDGVNVFVTGVAQAPPPATTARRSPTTRPPAPSCGSSATTPRQRLGLRPIGGRQPGRLHGVCDRVQLRHLLPARYHLRFDYASLAYSAGTGAQLSVKRYNGPGKDVEALRWWRSAPPGTACSSPGSAPAPPPTLTTPPLPTSAALHNLPFRPPLPQSSVIVIGVATITFLCRRCYNYGRRPGTPGGSHRAWLW